MTAASEIRPSAASASGAASFDLALGKGRGTRESDTAHEHRLTPALPELDLAGGALGGVDVDLLSVAPDRKIASIKALRAVTGESLRWAKDTTDRVSRGESLRVTVYEHPDPLETLDLAGWEVRYSGGGPGRSQLRVNIPVEHEDALLQWLAEHDGRRVTRTPR